MILAIGIIIFFIGCIVSSVDKASESAKRREEQRHRELMDVLREHKEEEISPTLKRVIRRRIAQDKEGNVLAEEVTEETV